MRRLFYALCIVALSGCGTFTICQYDQTTVDQIQVTIRNENKDYERFLGILEALKIDSAMVNAVLEVVHDSEIARLNAWVEYETAKKAK